MLSIRHIREVISELRKGAQTKKQTPAEEIKAARRIMDDKNIHTAFCSSVQKIFTHKNFEDCKLSKASQYPSILNTVDMMLKANNVDSNYVNHFTQVCDLFNSYYLRVQDEKKHGTYLNNRAHAKHARRNSLDGHEKMFEGTGTRPFQAGFSDHTYKFAYFFSRYKHVLSQEEQVALIGWWYAVYLANYFHSFCEVDAAFLRAKDDFHCPELDLAQMAEMSMKEIAAKKIQQAFRTFHARKIKIVQSGGWITGSDGAMILPMLAKTGLTLMPTGDLLTHKIAPICGEINNPRGIGIKGVNMTCLSGVLIPNVSGNRSSNEIERYKLPEADEGMNLAWGYARVARRHASIKNIVDSQKSKLQTLIQSVSLILQAHSPNNEYQFVTVVKLLITALQLQQLDSSAYNEFQNDVNNIARRITEKGVHFWDSLALNIVDAKIDIEEMRLNIQRIINAFSSLESTIKFTPDEQKKLDATIEKDNRNFPVLFLSMRQFMDQKKCDHGYLGGEVTYRGRLKLGKEVKMIITDVKHRLDVYNFVKNNNLLGKVFICEKELFLKLRVHDRLQRIYAERNRESAFRIETHLHTKQSKQIPSSLDQQNGEKSARKCKVEEEKINYEKRRAIVAHEAKALSNLMGQKMECSRESRLKWLREYRGIDDQTLAGRARQQVTDQYIAAIERDLFLINQAKAIMHEGNTLRNLMGEKMEYPRKHRLDWLREYRGIDDQTLTGRARQQVTDQYITAIERDLFLIKQAEEKNNPQGYYRFFQPVLDAAYSAARYVAMPVLRLL